MSKMKRKDPLKKKKQKEQKPSMRQIAENLLAARRQEIKGNNYRTIVNLVKNGIITNETTFEGFKKLVNVLTEVQGLFLKNNNWTVNKIVKALQQMDQNIRMMESMQSNIRIRQVQAELKKKDNKTPLAPRKERRLKQMEEHRAAKKEAKQI